MVKTPLIPDEGSSGPGRRSALLGLGEGAKGLSDVSGPSFGECGAKSQRDGHTQKPAPQQSIPVGRQDPNRGREREAGQVPAAGSSARELALGLLFLAEAASTRLSGRWPAAQEPTRPGLPSWK